MKKKPAAAKAIAQKPAGKKAVKNKSQKARAATGKMAAEATAIEVAKPKTVKKATITKKPKTAKKVKKAKKAARGKTPPCRPKLSRDEIEKLFAAFEADMPEPKGELYYTNPYTLLVAVALSAQATDAGVNKATRKLFERADTPQKMVALGEDAVREQIKTIGLFRNKAKNVIALSKMLIDEWNGEVPQDRAALERLPGVGRKTANVVLNIAFGQPTIAVDTHLFRVCNRTGLAPGKDPLAVELCLLKVVPEHYLLHAHHWLILHGRYTCLARKPKCPVCIIREFCRFKDKTELQG